MIQRCLLTSVMYGFKAPKLQIFAAVWKYDPTRFFSWDLSGFFFILKKATHVHATHDLIF